jgi:hypothetical protein
VDLSAVMAEKDFLDAVVKPKVKSRKSKVAQKRNIAEGLVQASAKSGEDDDLFGIQGQRVSNGKFKVGFVFFAGKLNRLRSFVGQRSKVESRIIHIADNDVWNFPQRKGMTGPAVGGNDEIVLTQQGAGFFGVRQIAVGKDDDARHVSSFCRPSAAFGAKKILRKRRIKVSGKESLRWHYPVQVMRVERLLLSA